MPHVLSVQVGLPREHPPERPGEPAVRTGLVKLPVDGPVHVTAAGLAGDGQASLGAHGGADRAVLSYPGAHYDLWRAEYGGAEFGVAGQARNELARFEFTAGTFGENLTVASLDERTVCIGDRYRIGGVTLEVSMPRSPCAKLNWRTGIPLFLGRVQATARIGWLHRVIDAGAVQAGDAITLLERPHPGWTVERTYRVVEALKARDASQIVAGRDLLLVAPLAAGWRERISELVAAL